jgi:hypothetical protein
VGSKTNLTKKTLKPTSMKKLFYVLALTLITAASLSSCTEDNVKPREVTTTDKCAFGGPGCK